jgi:hypothetical protein
MKRPASEGKSAGALKFLAILVIALFLPASAFPAQDFSNPDGFHLAQSEARN